MNNDTYGPNGEFRRIPHEIQMQARKASIARWARKNNKKAKERLLHDNIPEEDAKIIRVALGLK